MRNKTKFKVFNFQSGKLLTIIGVLFILLYAFTIVFDLRIEKKCKPKVALYQSLKVGLTLEHLKFEDAISKGKINEYVNDGSTIKILINKLNAQLQVKYWDDFLLLNYTAKDLEALKIVLQKIKIFRRTLIKKNAQQTISFHDKNDDANFDEIISDLENIRLAQYNRMMYHNFVLHRFQLILFLIFLLYLVIIIFTIKKLLKTLQTKNKFLKDSKEELQKSQEIAQLGTYNLNLISQTATTSTIFNKIVGFRKGNTKSFDLWRSTVHPDDVPKNKKALEHCLKTGEKLDHEYRILTKGKNELKWIHGMADVVFKDNRPTNLIGNIQDITARKLVEEKLKQSDVILNTLNSLVMVTDEKGNITYISPSVKAVLGYEPEEILGQGWWILTAPKRADAFKIRDAVVNNLYKNNPLTPHIKNRKIKAKNGSFKTFEWHNSKGINNTIISLCIDITKRKHEEKIKEVIFNISKKANQSLNIESLFNFIKLELGQLINTSNFFIALYDKTTDMISTPYMVDEEDDDSDFPKGKTLTSYVIDSKKSLLANETVLKKLERAKKIERFGPSSKCWLGVPLLINDEAIGAIVIQSYTNENAYTQKEVSLLELIASNISQAIKQSRDFEKINLLNQALFQSPESIVIANLEGEIEYVNPTFTNISGYSAEEAIGQNPRLLKSGEQPPEVYDNLWKTITSGKIWEGELINQHKDGSRYLVDANIVPVKDLKGNITHFIGIEQNITEKRKLERDFIHAFVDAQEQEKQSFGEDLHDGISQILAAESMYIDVLMRLDKKDDAKITGFLTKIRELNLKATNDARNIAHGLMSKQLKEGGLLKAIAQICIDYSFSRNINFSFTHKDVEEADFSNEIKTNVFRIFQEISTNTIRHSGAKKALISINKTKQNQLKLIFKDDGVGIDFKKMKRDNRGAGLKNIEHRVTLLNGKLELDTAPNKGICYTILIPLKSLH